uniref:FLYWCH-type domain-containing protein n=1 Tax=Anopheles farauti TaxID=69004 RepID=A0A182QAN2_9DIPT
MVDSSWIMVDRSDIQYTTTQRGRTMLNFGGYRFVENRQSKRNIFWRCACYVKHTCRATCVTSKTCLNEQLIRLTGLAHSHPPEMAVKTEQSPERKPTVEGEEEAFTLYRSAIDDLQLSFPDQLSNETQATFGVSQRGAKKLIFNRYEYVKDREFPESINWRCALFKRYSCRARAITKEANGQTFVRLTNHEHNHTHKAYRKSQRYVADGFQRAKFGITRRGHQMLLHRGHRYVREKQKGTFVPATFGKTRRGQLKLLYDGHAYTRDRQSVKTCNWKCSLFTRYRCRARAVTKDIDGMVHMKVTNTAHYHPREEYKMKIKKESMQQDP